MSIHPFSVLTSEEKEKAANLLLANKIGSLPVNEDGKLSVFLHWWSSPCLGSGSLYSNTSGSHGETLTCHTPSSAAAMAADMKSILKMRRFASKCIPAMIQVEIVVEAVNDLVTSERGRFALLNIPKHLFSSALGEVAQRKGTPGLRRA
jgi:hypothetical protein